MGKNYKDRERKVFKGNYKDRGKRENTRKRNITRERKREQIPQKLIGKLFTRVMQATNE